LEVLQEYWSQIIVLVGALIAGVKINAAVQTLRRDVDQLERDLERRGTYVQTVKLRAEVDQQAKNISSLWDAVNNIRERISR
jgi:outer membrane murein-binding lipoprotein Lpp